MIEFINKFTGTRMWVAEQRIDEYLEAGHKLASDCAATKVAEEKEPKPAKKATKKATKIKK